MTGRKGDLPYVSSLPSLVNLFIEASVSFFTGKMTVDMVPLSLARLPNPLGSSGLCACYGHNCG